MRLIATRVIAVFLLPVCSMFAQQEPLKLGVNVLDVNDWSGSPYFSDLLHHARARSPHAQKPLWTVEGQEEHPLLGVRPQLTDAEIGGLVSGAFGTQNTQIRRITGTNPSVRVADGFLHPSFVSALQGWTGYIRLMDWGGVFADRSADLPASEPQSANGHTDGDGRLWSENQGSPWSYAAEIAKLYDVWLCIPSLATVDDARAMGEYFGRVARKRVAIEWSNELWNSAFPQNRLIRVGANWDEYLMTALRMAQERVNAFEIGFRSTGNTNSLCKVFAWQLGDDAGPLWNFRRETWGERNVVNPAARALLARFDALAIAPYFGHRDGSTDILSDVRALEAPLAIAREIVSEVGVLLLGYEGGQHYVGSNSVALQRSPQMGEAMGEYLRLCDRFLDELVLYALVGRASAQHGSWGLMEKWGDDAAPKMAAVRAWLAGNGGGSGGGGNGGGGGGQEIAARVAALEALVATLQAQTAQAIADAAAASAEVRRLQAALRDAVR